jgi:hypothetical protein
MPGCTDSNSPRGRKISRRDLWNFPRGARRNARLFGGAAGKPAVYRAGALRGRGMRRSLLNVQSRDQPQQLQFRTWTKVPGFRQPDRALHDRA